MPSSVQAELAGRPFIPDPQPELPGVSGGEPPSPVGGPEDSPTFNAPQGKGLWLVAIRFHGGDI